MCSNRHRDAFSAGLHEHMEPVMNADLSSTNHYATENTGRWSNNEHSLFLKALMIYGRKWKCISDYVGTRSVVQVRTHAQKHFLKLAKHNDDDGMADQDANSKRATKRGRPRFDEGDCPSRSKQLKKNAAVKLQLGDVQKLYDFLTPASNDTLRNSCQSIPPPSPTSVSSNIDLLPSWCETATGIDQLLEKAEILNWEKVAKDQTSSSNSHQLQHSNTSEHETGGEAADDYFFFDGFSNDSSSLLPQDLLNLEQTLDSFDF